MTTLALIKDAEHRDVFVNNLNDQRKDGEFCDVMLKVSGHTLPTHGCVLSACSSVFRELIHANRSPDVPGMPQEIDVVMPGADDRQVGGLEAMQDLINYIYTGDIHLKRESIDLVIKLAEAFMLEGLTTLITTHVNYKPQRNVAVSEVQPSSYIHTLEPTTGHSEKDIQKLNATTQQVVQANHLPGPNRPASPRRRERRGASPQTAVRRRPRAIRPKPDSNYSSSTILKLAVEMAPVLPPLKRRGRPRGVFSKKTKLKVIRPRTGETETHVATAATAIEPEVRVLRARKLTTACRSADDSESGDGEKSEREKDGVSDRSKRSVCGPDYVYHCRFLHCDFASGDAGAIGSHKEVHPGTSYKCLYCDFITGHCVKLVSHLRESDHGQTECSLCGLLVADRLAFLEHLKRHDDPRGPFFCWICDHHFRNRSNLSDHVAKHASDRPYVCEECGKGFKWKTSLKVHRLSHGTRMHLCDQCGYSTAYRNNLKVHERKHGNMLKCAHCEYRTHCNTQMKRHQVRHQSNPKAFICDVCGGRFSQSRGLDIHVKTFHDPAGKKLRCDFCDFVTIRRHRYLEHVKRHHGVQGSASGQLDLDQLHLVAAQIQEK